MYIINLSFLSMCSFLFAAVPTTQDVDQSSMPRPPIQSSYYKDDDDVSREELQYVHQALESLEKLVIPPQFSKAERHIGQELVKTLDQLLAKQQKNLQFYVTKKDDEPIHVTPPKEGETIVLTINLKQLKSSTVGCLIPKKYMLKKSADMSGNWQIVLPEAVSSVTAEKEDAPPVSTPVSEIHNVYPIWYDENPPHITLGHELIHVIHILEDKEGYDSRKRKIDTSIWPSAEFHNIRKGEGSRCEKIWMNLEEQVTTLGKFDTDLSEFWLRIAAGRLPRYPYHENPAINPFLESEPIIQAIMLRLIGDDWEKLLQEFQSVPGLDAITETEKFVDSKYSIWRSVPSGPQEELLVNMLPDSSQQHRKRSQAFAERLAKRQRPSVIKGSE